VGGLSLEINNTEIQNRLQSLVRSLAGGGSGYDDLMQEALIHLHERQLEEPGHSPSFYLQSCRFLIMDCLRQGRSVDSTKRQHLRQSIDDFAEGGDNPCPLPDVFIFPEQTIASVTMAEIQEKLRLQLQPLGFQILELLLKGNGIREIALSLNISHPAVLRHRRRIAELAISLDLVPGFRPPKD
jgi:DNA-binding CsgD family transcriptional regulator